VHSEISASESVWGKSSYQLHNSLFLPSPIERKRLQCATVTSLSFLHKPIQPLLVPSTPCIHPIQLWRRRCRITLAHNQIRRAQAPRNIPMLHAQILRDRINDSAGHKGVCVDRTFFPVRPSTSSSMSQPSPLGHYRFQLTHPPLPFPAVNPSSSSLTSQLVI
jgi:hypothetical protein